MSKIQVWGCYADGYALGVSECTSMQIPGSSLDAIQAVTLEFRELYGVNPTAISVTLISDVVIIN